MDGAKTRAYRAAHGLTQAELADAMGMPRRTFQDAEAAVSGFRPVHENAFHFASMKLALERRDPEFLTDEAAAVSVQAATLAGVAADPDAHLQTMAMLIEAAGGEIKVDPRDFSPSWMMTKDVEPDTGRHVFRVRR